MSDQTLRAVDAYGVRSMTSKKRGLICAVKTAKSAPTKPVIAATHVVKPGETLFRISRRYGIEVEKLIKMNKLSDDIIEVGQKLIVGME